MSRATWSRPTSERLAVRRRHERVDPRPQKFADGRAQSEESEEGSGLRPRSRADGCRLAASTSVCGSREPAADGLGGAPGALKLARDVAGGLCGREERRGSTSGSRSLGGAPGSLTRSRMRAVSSAVTPGSSFADVGLSTHSAPTPPRSRAGVPPGRSHRPLSRSRRHVGRRGARRARSLRRCRSATTGLSRARFSSRCSRLCCHGSSLHPGLGPPGEPVGASRQPGTELGDDPAKAVRDLAQRALGLVDACPDETLLATPAGTMMLATYLPTRTFELTVHSLDLTRSLETGLPAASAPAIVVCGELASALAARRPNAASRLLTVTGRNSDPASASVL